MFIFYFVAYLLEIWESIYFFDLAKQLTSLSFLLFWISYCIFIVVFSCLYGVFYRVALLVNSICFRYLGRTLLMILNKLFYSITL